MISRSEPAAWPTISTWMSSPDATSFSNAAARAGIAKGDCFCERLASGRIDLQQERTRCRFATFLQQCLFVKWSKQSDDASYDAASMSEEIVRLSGLTLDQLLILGADVADLVVKEGIKLPVHAADSSDNGQATPEPTDIQEPFPGLGSFDSLAQRTIADVLIHPTHQFSVRLWPEIAKLIDVPEFRLAGATAVYEHCLSHLARISQKLADQLASSRRALDLATCDAESPEGGSLSPVDDAQIQKLRHHETTLLCTIKLVEAIRQSDAELLREFATVQELLETTASIAKSSMQETTPPRPAGVDFGAVVSGFLNRHVGLFVSQLETFLERSYLQSLGGLRHVAANGTKNASQFADAIQAESRRLVAGSFQGINFDAVMESAAPGEGPKMLLLQKETDNALPQLSDCGGGIRMMIAVPPATTAETFADCAKRLFREPPTLLRRTDGDVAICFEGQNVLAANVGVRLLDERPDAAELISRVSSRSDVEWIPLTGLA